ncbi:hypothetical protein [Anaeromassilibacillus senegalensis]|uniref:hypothetical protein n=1 Tax=Anaeromassilibacillus senegalensis TaxID=1673717 RepID=UPI0018A84925|nr:hypothetical protein [Anaeromassilibacillus senegalensis]
MECNGRAVKIIRDNQPVDIDGIVRTAISFLTNGDPAGYIDSIKKRRAAGQTDNSKN